MNNDQTPHFSKWRNYSFEDSPLKNHIAISLIFLLWLVLFVPYLDIVNFHHEEGRRALTAREMLHNGDYFVPTVLGKVYLNKPPGFTWILAGFASLFGGIDEWSVRFPSALATLVTALLVLSFAPKEFSLSSRLLGAIFFLYTAMSIEKGRLGEIEAVFTTFVWGSLWFWWASQTSAHHIFASIASGVCLAGALLTKGPPAIVFFYGAIIPFCYWTGCLRWLLSRQHLIVLAVLIALGLIWLVPFLRQVGLDQPLQVWGEQMARTEVPNSDPYLLSKLILLVSLILGLMPGSYFFSLLFKAHVRERIRFREPATFFLYVSIIIPFIVFFLLPNSRARYLYPVSPCVALLAGVVVYRLWNVHEQSAFYARALFRWSVWFVAVVAALAIPIYLHQQYSLLSYTLIFISLLSLCLCIAHIALWKSPQEKWKFGLILLVYLCVLLEFIVGETIVNQRKYEYNKRFASMLETRTSNDQRLYTLFWDEFNLFIYFEKPVIYVPTLKEVSWNQDNLPCTVLSKEDLLLTTQQLEHAKTDSLPYGEERIFFYQFRRPLML